MSNQRPPAKSKKISISTIVVVGVIVLILIGTAIFAVHSLTTPLTPTTTTKSLPPTSVAPTTTTTSNTPTSDTPTSDQPTDTATGVPIAQATIGTCFDRQATIDSGSVYIAPIDCTQPHDSEIFYSSNMTASSYPDTAGWKQLVLDNCHPAFKTYTGVTFGQNAWQIYYIYPPQQLWDNGNHLLLCYATAPLGDQVASIKASK